MAVNSPSSTVSQVTTLARTLSVCPPPLSPISAADEDSASQLHQQRRPELPEGIDSPEPVIECHLAQIYPRQQKDALVQR